MLKRILFVGLTFATASFGSPGSANAHRYGLSHHGPWLAHTWRGGGTVRWRGAAYARPVARVAWQRGGWRGRAHPSAVARLAHAAPPASTLRAAPAAGGAIGRASFYSGGRTASGGAVGAATCAHRSLPFGTRVLVTNLANLRQMVLTVNDRGPFVGGRIVDVSRTAAAALGMLQSGVATVRMQVVGGPG